MSWSAPILGRNSTKPNNSACPSSTKPNFKNSSPQNSRSSFKLTPPIGLLTYPPHNLSYNCFAGESGDRWRASQEAAREESPDSRIDGSQGPQFRATRLVTPGGRASNRGHGKCHREQTAAWMHLCDGLEGNLEAISSVAIRQG